MITVKPKYNADYHDNIDNPIKPLLIIKHKNIYANYFYDGSGEFVLLDRKLEFYFGDDGKITDHIEDIEEHIASLQNQLVASKEALTELKKAKKKAKL